MNLINLKINLSRIKIALNKCIENTVFLDTTDNLAEPLTLFRIHHQAEFVRFERYQSD